MKKAIVNSVIILFSTLVSVLLLYSCTEEFDYGKSVNAVNTIESSAVLQTTANVLGNIITDNGAGLTARGICYSTNNNPTITGLKKPDSQAYLGSFTCTLINLAPSTIYFARAYATNSYGTAYGKEITFKTLAATIPIISSTTAVGFITQTSAVAGGTITNSGASNITSRGVCWSSTITVPTISNSKTIDGIGIGTFTSTLASLTPNTIYYVRAYATNGVGTGYGDVKAFTTSTATIPVVSSTIAATSISLTTAISGGTITSDNGATITSRGVCWSNSTSSPTIINSKTIDGTGIGTFSSSLTRLLPGTTYYIRAYATNSIGTAYATVKSFTTIAATLPIVSTTIASAITYTTASSGGSVSSDGGATISARGICWSSVTSSPTIANTKTIDGSDIGTFSSSLTDLAPGTTYYIRAYATNSIGTAYGSAVLFKTVAATIPTGVTTSAITSITQITASSGGSVSGDGGSPITLRGVCWSGITSNPTIYDSYANDLSGNATFTSSLFGLSANTTYYVRAFAMNSVGFTYGNTITFTTLPNLAIGQSYQGGIIAYIFVSGDSDYVAGQTHGLIATTSNQSTGAQWGCSGTSIAGTSTALGTGLANTTAIVNGCTSSISAAALCNNLSSGGYSDWYLPSRDELNKLYLNKTSIGGFSTVSYWCSTQSASTTAYSINFSSGTGTGFSTKTTLMYVRAIRKF